MVFVWDGVYVIVCGGCGGWIGGWCIGCVSLFVLLCGDGFVVLGCLVCIGGGVVDGGWCFVWFMVVLLVIGWCFMIESFYLLVIGGLVLLDEVVGCFGKFLYFVEECLCMLLLVGFDGDVVVYC